MGARLNSWSRAFGQDQRVVIAHPSWRRCLSGPLVTLRTRGCTSFSEFSANGRLVLSDFNDSWQGG